MANTILLPFMLLEIPIVGVEVGPAWAAEINQAFTRIDEHDHTTGKGVLIPTAGLNINADLSISGFNVISVRSLRGVNNSAVLSTGADVNCFYVVNGDAYFNNSAGTPVQITSGAGLNFASLGTIGGDYGQPSVTASVTYSDALKTYSFTQAASTPAKMYMGDIILQAPVNGTQAITIKADPTTSSYTLRLPLSLPASKKILTMTGAGEVNADYDTDNITLEVSGSNLQIKNDGVTTPKILDQNVTTAKIADANVTLVKLGADVSIGGITLKQRYTSGSGNFAVPAGVEEIVLRVTPAGGGGGGGAGKNVGGGGAGGSAGAPIYVRMTVTPSTNIAYAVGAGGTAGAGGGINVTGSSGGTGSNTTFGALTFYGAAGGAGGTGSTATGNAASLSKGMIYLFSGNGGPGNVSGTAGESSIAFSGGAGGVNGGGGGAGGGGGGAASYEAAGGSGNSNGGGGGIGSDGSLGSGGAGGQGGTTGGSDAGGNGGAGGNAVIDIYY